MSEVEKLREELAELQRKFDVVASMVPVNCDTCKYKRFYADENIYNQHRCINVNQKEYHACWELRTEPLQVVRGKIDE